MRSVLFPVLALVLSGCATLPDQAIRSDGLARLGEATRVGSLLVTPRAMVEDSRCPINALCVWAGRAIVRTDVAGAGWRETINLTLGERISIHGTPLALTSVEPAKMAGTPPIPPRAMLLRFEGGQ